MIIEKCGFCYKEIEIPKNLHEKIEKIKKQPLKEKVISPLIGQHNLFYISYKGEYYCSKEECLKDYLSQEYG